MERKKYNTNSKHHGLHMHVWYVIFPLLLLSICIGHEELAFGQTNNSTTPNPPENTGNYLKVISNSEGYKQVLQLPIDQFLFNVSPQYDQQGNLVSFSMNLKPENQNFYQEAGLFDKPRDIVFVYPSFTQAAYGPNGFYDYYHGKCDTSCLTVKIPDKVIGYQSSSIAGASALKLLNFPYVKDEDIDKNPDILKQYKRVIVLHNEYVTKTEFDAITSHPDVVFLYPNALYAEVKTDYTTNTITLVRGHGYPDPSTRNGFDWKDDNSKYEYNVSCDDWTYFLSKDGYTMLNCYPEYKILYTPDMLTLLQNSDPTQLLQDIGNWLRYGTPQSTQEMLADYDVNGTHTPQWVTNPSLWLENGQISRSEFYEMIHYLYKNSVIR